MISSVPIITDIYVVFPFGCGTKSQLIVMAAINPTNMGCITETPTCAPRTPVTMGKKEPPI
jgi:hypothetical protein